MMSMLLKLQVVSSRRHSSSFFLSLSRQAHKYNVTNRVMSPFVKLFSSLLHVPIIWVAYVTFCQVLSAAVWARRNLGAVRLGAVLIKNRHSASGSGINEKIIVGYNRTRSRTHMTR